MYGDRELEAKIKEYEDRLTTEESKYVEAVRSRKNYDTLRAIRINIRDMKQELNVLYNMRDRKM